MSTNHGSLCSIKTGESIRPATEDEWFASMDATLDDGGRGAFDSDDAGACYVVARAVRVLGLFAPIWWKSLAVCSEIEQV